MLCSESSCHVIQTQDKRFHSVEDAMEVRIDYMRVAPEAFKAMSVNTAQFWTRMGEQWQKDWAQMMMSQWVGRPTKRNVPRKSDDRE